MNKLVVDAPNFNIIRVNAYCGWSIYDHWLYKDVYRQLLGGLAYDASVNGITTSKLEGIFDLHIKYMNALDYEYNYNIPSDLDCRLDSNKALNNTNYFVDEWTGPIYDKVNVEEFTGPLTGTEQSYCYYCTALEYKDYFDDASILVGLE